MFQEPESSATFICKSMMAWTFTLENIFIARIHLIGGTISSLLLEIILKHITIPKCCHRCTQDQFKKQRFTKIMKLNVERIICVININE